MKKLRAVVAFLAAAFFTMPACAEDATPSRGFVLAVHGGAGDYGSDTKERLDIRRATITKAVEAGRDVLARGGSSLDAVETILVVMEDSGLFDAGKGAYYTREGVPELDAAIMDGKTLGAGSVAAVKRVKNPIRLARLVMEKTPHVLLVGAGADDFARTQGASLVSPFYFYNEREFGRFQKKQEAEEKKADAKIEPGHGTVGAVVLDRAGNLAAGTSTGGTTWKLPGRVGDSPIIGAGTYASNESCAVSGTGLGEFFMRNVVASDIAARVKYLKQSLKDAADEVVMKELVAQKGEGGVIALDRKGNVATPFNTNGMLRAVLREGGAIEVRVFHAE
jgi:beta-aspartyl-peptidase (threonine type)